MATFKRGLDAQDRIQSKLEAYGCRLQVDEGLDHKQKLDFVITRFPDNPAFYACGVQVTTKVDSFDKQEEFWKINNNSRVTPKALYIELDGNIDLEDGGAMAVYIAIAEFSFDRAHVSKKIGAVRIYEDLSIEFFDLEQQILQLRKSPLAALEARFGRHMVPAPAAADQVRSAWKQEVQRDQKSGTIDTYFRSGGHGFIHTESDVFFFHINHVSDEELRDRLNAIPYGSAPVQVGNQVVFRDCGKTRTDAKYPEARDVKLAS